MRRPKIPGLRLVSEIPHNKHGSAGFCQPVANIVATSCECSNGIEVSSVETSDIQVTFNL